MKKMGKFIVVLWILFFSVASQAAEVGDRVCTDETETKSGWCGYITQVLGKSVRIENYNVFCKDGGFLGICTNVSMGVCGGRTERLYTSDDAQSYKNPKSIIVPSGCFNNDKVASSNWWQYSLVSQECDVSLLSPQEIISMVISEGGMVDMFVNNKDEKHYVFQVDMPDGTQTLMVLSGSEQKCTKLGAVVERGLKATN